MSDFNQCHICGEYHWSNVGCLPVFFWQILYDGNEANFADYTGARLATELDKEGFSKIRATDASDADDSDRNARRGEAVSARRVASRKNRSGQSGDL